MERLSEEAPTPPESGAAAPESEKGLTIVGEKQRRRFKFARPAMSKKRAKLALSLAGALTTLYVFVSLLFAGLLVATIESLHNVRALGRIPAQVERPLTDLNGDQLTRTLVRAGPDFPAVTAARFFNRPDGCELSSDGSRQDCDVDNDESGRWVLFPWVSDNLELLQSVMDCPVEDQTFVSLLPNGNVGDGDGNLGEGVCINFVPLDRTAELRVDEVVSV